MLGPKTRLLLPFLVMALVSLDPGAMTGAHAADCGDGIAPCGCGDTVVVDTTLDASDPVTTMICSCSGLSFAPGVTLDLGGHSIRGSDQCTGLGGADSVSVLNGRILHFSTGLAGQGNSRFAGLEIADNDIGVLLSSGRNLLEKSVVHDNREVGISVGRGGNVIRNVHVLRNAFGIRLGDSNVVERSVVSENVEGGISLSFASVVSNSQIRNNGGAGIVGGDIGTRIIRNVVTRNAGTGVLLSGGGHIVDQNRIMANQGHGLWLSSGGGYTVTNNITSLNGVDLEEFHGILVEAVDSDFTGNRSDRNPGGFGIKATAGGNSYESNICNANGLGDSDPPNLCR